ncbi:MAG: hypothetical protein JWN50_516 [Parcubacteria group bacterium]|nr:hypothetical protein [Parcubacteria group bacterium]
MPIMTNSNKTIISVVILIVLIAGGWYILSHRAATSGPAATANAPVATVNGENIVQSDLTAAELQISQGVAATTTDAQATLKSQALDSLIAKTLLKQAAEKAGITASSTQIDASLSSIKSQFQTQDAYTQALASQGVTEDQLKAEISGNLVIQNYLDQTLGLSSVTASEAEIKAFYDQAAAGQTGVPALATVHDQVKQAVIQQKQGNLIDAYVLKLRSTADIKILN